MRLENRAGRIFTPGRLLLLLLLTAAPGAAWGQTPAPSPAPAEEATLIGEVARLNRSMDQLVRMLGAFLEQQESDLLLKRFQVLHDRLAPAEAELKNARREYEELQAEMESLETRHGMFLERWRSEADRGERPASEIEREQEHIEFDFKSQMEVLTQRRDAAYGRIQTLESDLMGRREDILILEEMLDERLGLR